MRQRLLLTMVVAGLMSAAVQAGGTSPASAAAVIHVATSGTDVPGCGSSGAPCATVPFAYNEAAAGDTIKVAAGRYEMTSTLVIAKAGLRLEGARAGVDARTRAPGGPGETVITAPPATRLSREDIWIADADNVVINGFTFEGNAGGAGVSTSENHSGYQVSDDIFAGNLKGFAPSSDGVIASVFSQNLYYDNNNTRLSPGSQGNGVFTFRPLANASFTRSKFLDNDNAPVNIAGGEVPGGSHNITISGNNMDGEFGVTLVAVSDVVITKNEMNGGWNAVQVSGACSNITITDNSMNDKTRGGILLFTGFAAVTNTGITIAGNTIDRTATVPGRYAIEISRSTGVTIRHNLIEDSGEGGIGFTPRGQEVPSSAATITQNTIYRSAGPGIEIQPGTYTGSMTARYNRIVDNDPHRGIVNDSAGAHVDAQLNWWGCNHLPDGAGCDQPSGSNTGQITYRPWLVLTIASSPASLRLAQRATIIATLHQDNEGVTHSGPFFRPVVTRFTVTAGSLAPGHVITSALLRAATAWHAGHPGPVEICATIDNQTVCLHARIAPSPRPRLHPRLRPSAMTPVTG